MCPSQVWSLGRCQTPDITPSGSVSRQNSLQCHTVTPAGSLASSPHGALIALVVAAGSFMHLPERELSNDLTPRKQKQRLFSGRCAGKLRQAQD